MRTITVALLAISLVAALSILMPDIAAQAKERTSGPLTFVGSDINPKTVFWIQGRFVPVDNPKYQGDAEVTTILCTVREYECLEIDSEIVGPDAEQAWIQDFRPVSWDKDGIVADSRSLDGCTDETLKIRFSPPSVGLINSPVLPISENCEKINHAWDKLLDKKGVALKDSMEQDMLVPTRGMLSFQDSNFKFLGPSKRKHP